MEPQEFKRQLAELHKIIADGIAYFSAWRMRRMRRMRRMPTLPEVKLWSPLKWSSYRCHSGDVPLRAGDMQ